LSRPFAIASGTVETTRNVFLSLQEEDDDRVGWGEHAPSQRVTGESLADVRKELAELVANPDWVERLLEDAKHMPDGTPRPGARNALAGAWLDLEGQRRSVGAHQILNLPDGRISSSITIPIQDPESAARLAVERNEQGWGCFKIKLGGEHDEAVVKAVRDRLPDAPIRVDANEGWTRATAKKMLPILHRLEVEFVEQPLSRDDWDGLKALKDEHELPIFLDESVLESQGLLKAIREGAGDGVVIKLAKCGGPFEARRMVKVARDHGWKIMVGCMIESSAGIAAASTLAGVADYLDLDGSALLADEPFESSSVTAGRVTTPQGPGLGVRRKDGGAPLGPLGG
jgi:o-succinylbenzoate synthase